MSSPVKTRHSLRTKLMLTAFGMAFIFSIIWGTWNWHQDRAALVQALEESGTVLVSSMAIPIINALVYEELGLISEGGLLDNFIIDIMQNPQLQPVYALVTDTEGKVIAHSQFNRFGEILSDPLTRKLLTANAITIQQHNWQEQDILDIGTPLAIHGKRWGSLRVGFPLAPLKQKLRSLAIKVFSFSCLSVLTATLLFFFISSRFVAPLLNLTRTMKQLDANQLGTIPASSRDDELGLLQNSFSQMVERLRKSEREREKSTQQLLENERLVTAGRIVSGVAHEINNPLSGMITSLAILEKKPQALERYLPVLTTEAERISAIVAQLLDLSRAGELSKEQVEVKRLCTEIMRICDLALKGRKVKLQLVKPIPEVTVECDPRKLQQVVLNLVINAADALQGRGLIRLKCSCRDNQFCLQVEDDGPGIPFELREKIFKPFFTTKPAGAGTGIGLSFSRGTIEKHGGTLELLDADSGACFEIRLPLLAPVQTCNS